MGTDWKILMWRELWFAPKVDSDTGRTTGVTFAALTWTRQNHCLNRFRKAGEVIVT